MNNVVWLLIM